MLGDFNVRLLKNLGILVKELSGRRLDDTDNFLKSIIEAMNWEIQAMNGTMELLNEGHERINKQEFNSCVTAVSDAVLSGDDSRMAEAFKGVIPCFELLGKAVAEVI